MQQTLLSDGTVGPTLTKTNCNIMPIPTPHILVCCPHQRMEAGTTKPGGQATDLWRMVDISSILEAQRHTCVRVIRTDAQHTLEARVLCCNLVQLGQGVKGGEVNTILLQE